MMPRMNLLEHDKVDEGKLAEKRMNDGWGPDGGDIPLEGIGGGPQPFEQHGWRGRRRARSKDLRRRAT